MVLSIIGISTSLNSADKIMSEIGVFLEHIKSNGKAVSAINPDSDEMALSVEDALQAVELLRNTNTPILGGDILTCNTEGLIYAYQSWGSEHHYLNWYCDKSEDENQEEYKERSFDTAIKAINQAAEIAAQLDRSCYIVLVV